MNDGDDFLGECHSCCDTEKKSGAIEPGFPSVVRPLLLMVVAVFLVESVVETGLLYFFGSLLSAHVFLDATITIIVLLPLFYFLLYSPFQKLDKARLSSEEEIHSLSRQLIRTQEEERQALARDLHDDFGQILTALHLGIETIKLTSTAEGLTASDCETRLDVCKRQGERLADLVSGLGDRVRSISSGLRPTMLDELGLLPTLEWLVSDFKEQCPQVDVSFSHGGVQGRYYADLELTLFRICQEALNNIAKHASAKTVSITIQKKCNDLVLSIRDDGLGFGDEELRSARAGRRGTGKRGVGLLGMRERAAALEGDLWFSSEKGQGTEICAKIPAMQKRRKDEL